MKLFQWIVCGVLLSVFVCVQSASAQLLNYKRKDVRANKSNIRNIVNTPKTGPSNGYSAPAVEVAPVIAEAKSQKEKMIESVPEIVEKNNKIEKIEMIGKIEGDIPKIQVMEEMKKEVQSVIEPVTEVPELNSSLQNLGQKKASETSDPLAGDIKVKNRVEGIYDLDQDGLLQEAELQDFLGNVVNTVERRGSFRVSSDILKPFDVNSDGKITRYEVLTIKQKIN